MLVKIKENKGSMAVYTSVVLLGMLIILMAVFLTSNVVKREQLTTAMKVKESYEADNEKAAEIYSVLTKKVEPEGEYTKDGLILYYDGNNNTGNGHSSITNIWKDLSGNDNDGIFSKTPNTSEFYWEKNCITLSNHDGNLDSYVDTPISLNNTERTIIYTINGNKLSGAIWGDTDTSSFNGVFNYQSFITNRGANSLNQCKYDYTFNKNGIYNYAVTLNNTEMKFYENGELKATVNNTIGLKTSNNIRILATRNNGQNATNLKMYNFLVYNRVLSDSEIRNAYQKARSEYNF